MLLFEIQAFLMHSSEERAQPRRQCSCSWPCSKVSDNPASNLDGTRKAGRKPGGRQEEREGGREKLHEAGREAGREGVERRMRNQEMKEGGEAGESERLEKEEGLEKEERLAAKRGWRKREAGEREEAGEIAIERDQPRTVLPTDTGGLE